MNIRQREECQSVVPERGEFNGQLSGRQQAFRLESQAMRVLPQSDLEAIAEQIVADIHGRGNRYRHGAALAEWRSKLQKPPTALAPYQIDKIMREVQAKLASPG